MILNIILVGVFSETFFISEVSKEIVVSLFDYTLALLANFRDLLAFR